MKLLITRKVRLVIQAIHTLDQPRGLTICRETGLGTGTVYPILDLLVRAEWAGTRTEETVPPGRPARTFYHLTLRGQMRAGLEPKEPAN